MKARLLPGLLLAMLPAQGLAQEIGCQAVPADVLPPILDHGGWPAEAEFVIADSVRETTWVYRRIFSVRFAEDATGRTLNDLLCKYEGVVVGGRAAGRGYYAIRFADPGPDWTQVNAFRDSLLAESGVEFAAPFLATGPPSRVN